MSGTDAEDTKRSSKVLTLCEANAEIERLKEEEQSIVERLKSEVERLTRERDDLQRFKNEKAALIKAFKLPEKVCWGEVLQAIEKVEAELARLRERVKELEEK